MSRRKIQNLVSLGILSFFINIVCYNIFYGSFIFIERHSKTKHNNDSLKSVTESAKKHTIFYQPKNTKDYFVPGFSFPNKEICSNLGAGIKLLAIVISAPLNFEKRMAIRKTWGQTRNYVRVAFLMGTAYSPKVNNFVRNESHWFGDIIIARFQEHYRNLTLKSMSMLQWTADYCPKAIFLLKVDDDMYINLPRLLEFVEEHTQDKHIIYGQLVRFRKPDRWTGSMYFVPKEEYPQNQYPDYMLGPSYLFSASLASEMYQESLKQPFMAMEDVFITGLVAKSLKIERVQAAGFVNDQFFYSSWGYCSIFKVISMPMHKFYKIYQKCHKIFYE